MVPDPIRRIIERFLPWYDPEEEARRDARTEAIRVRSIKARVAAEAIQQPYREYAQRLRK